MNENHHEDQYSPLIKNGNATEGAHQTSISFFGPPTLSQLQHLTFLGLRVLSTSLLNTSFKLLIVWCPFFLVTFLEKVPCILSSSSTLVPNLQKRIPGPSSHCHAVLKRKPFRNILRQQKTSNFGVLYRVVFF